MKIFKTSEFLWVLACAVFCTGFMYLQATSLVEGNKWKDYHCAPITKHTSLESAKAQVLINQKLGEKL